MLPAFLITIREVIEATLIVATILGILYKLNQQKSVKTVWLATAFASIVSVGLLVIGSLIGVEIRELYKGKTEETIEGILMIISAGFITWAVFFLHTYFAQYKTLLLSQINKTTKQKKGGQSKLFLLVFTAVFREGIEIVLFLSTMYLASNPAQIFSGFVMGIMGGLAVSWLFFSTTLKIPLYYAFRLTSILLILFAAGLLAHGIHELHEAGFYAEYLFYL